MFLSFNQSHSWRNFFSDFYRFSRTTGLWLWEFSSVEVMSEGAAMIHNGGVRSQVQLYKEPPPLRQYPLKMLQVLGSGPRESASPASDASTPCRNQSRRDFKSKGDTAFGYDSDDSSLSSNASGSNKSAENGETTSNNAESNESHAVSGYQNGYRSGYNNTREWRGRSRRDLYRHRRMPDRYFHTYPYQVKYTPDDLLNGSKWDSMSQEVWEKFVSSQQTENTYRKKMNFFRYLFATIKAIFPRYGLYVVGSTMTGFGLESSDMDLCLLVRPLENVEARAHALLHLELVLGYIRALDPGAELVKAKVPILKFRDARSGLQMDLNCNNVVGVRNTQLLHWLAQLDWRVRPLVAVAKLWARAHDINDARRCSLSSYSLTLMVVQFLQAGARPAVLPRALDLPGAWAPAAANRQSLAELFVRLLKYYAEFPYERMAVSVRVGRPVPVADCRVARSHKNDPHQWKLLCVEEPFDLTNAARSVYDPETFEKIVNTFRWSYERVARSLRLQDAWPAPASACASAPAPA